MIRSPAGRKATVLRHGALLAAALAGTLLTGCATVYGTFGGDESGPPFTQSYVYTGTKSDAMLVGYSIYCQTAGSDCGGAFKLLILASPLILADMALSIGADTILLPYHLYKDGE